MRGQVPSNVFGRSPKFEIVGIRLSCVGVFFFLMTGTLIFAPTIRAWARVEWAGQWRTEYVEVSSVLLEGDRGGKSYVLSRFQLLPQVILGDGLKGIVNLEVLPSPAPYHRDQVGLPWGQPQSVDALGSQQAEPLTPLVREAYLRLENENSLLRVGRIPWHFGMGQYWNEGRGAFDHFSDNQDGLAARIFVGDSFFVEPFVGRVVEPTVERGGASEHMVHVCYQHKDSQSILALLYRVRRAPSSLLTTNLQSRYGAANVAGNWDTNSSHFYFSRGGMDWQFQMEAAFESGSTGMVDSQGRNIDWNGYGVHTEFWYRGEGSLSKWSVQVGLASGDDPNTPAYEGLQWHPNRDLGMFLGNHPLGQSDILRTARIRRQSQFPQAFDEESISNMIYIAPRWERALSRDWTWFNQLVWAQAQVAPVAGASQELGWEWNTGLNWSPGTRYQWQNGLGLFFPGEAFRAGSQQLPRDNIWGFQTRLSVSF